MRFHFPKDSDLNVTRGKEDSLTTNLICTSAVPSTNAVWFSSRKITKLRNGIGHLFLVIARCRAMKKAIIRIQHRSGFSSSLRHRSVTMQRNLAKFSRARARANRHAISLSLFLSRGVVGSLFGIARSNPFSYRIPGSGSWRTLLKLDRPSRYRIP